MEEATRCIWNLLFSATGQGLLAGTVLTSDLTVEPRQHFVGIHSFGAPVDTLLRGCKAKRAEKTQDPVLISIRYQRGMRFPSAPHSVAFRTSGIVCCGLVQDLQGCLLLLCIGECFSAAVSGNESRFAR